MNRTLHVLASEARAGWSNLRLIVASVVVAAAASILIVFSIHYDENFAVAEIEEVKLVETHNGTFSVRPRVSYYARGDRIDHSYPAYGPNEFPNWIFETKELALEFKQGLVEGRQFLLFYKRDRPRAGQLLPHPIIWDSFLLSLGLYVLRMWSVLFFMMWIPALASVYLTRYLFRKFRRARL